MASKQKILTVEEFSREIEKFFIKTCKANGPKSAHIGVIATLDAVSLSFRRIGEILTPQATDLDPEFWRSGSEYWNLAAQLVEQAKDKLKES